MSKARHILAVVAVTTVLCADRAVTAAPAPGPHVRDMAARLVERLSQPFRQAVPRALRPMNRSRAVFSALIVRPSPASEVSAHHSELSPFQFRLPPPII